MKSVGTKEEQRQVSAQAEPKDDESDFQDQRFQNCLDEIQKAVSSYPIEWRPKVLTAALERVTKGKGAVDKLVAMEAQVCKACDCLLDAKAKAVLVILGELSSVAGISNDVGGYGVDFLHSTYRGKQFVDEAQRQNPDNPELAILAEVYELAHCITENEFPQWNETATDEPEATQADEPEDTDTENEEAGPDTGIKALDDFLEKLSYEAQATAYGALRLVCVSDATGKKMSDYLRRQVALLDDPQQVSMMDSQVLADIKWFLGFTKGAEIGLEEC